MMNETENNNVFVLAVFARLFPQGTAVMVSEDSCKVTSPNGHWAEFSVRLVCNCYRRENLPFSDQQIVDELDSLQMWTECDGVPILPTFRKLAQ